MTLWGWTSSSSQSSSARSPPWDYSENCGMVVSSHDASRRFLNSNLVITSPARRWRSCSSRSSTSFLLTKPHLLTAQSQVDPTQFLQQPASANWLATWSRETQTATSTWSGYPSYMPLVANRASLTKTTDTSPHRRRRLSRPTMTWTIATGLWTWWSVASSRKISTCKRQSDWPRSKEFKHDQLQDRKEI